MDSESESDSESISGGEDDLLLESSTVSQKSNISEMNNNAKVSVAIVDTTISSCNSPASSSATDPRDSVSTVSFISSDPFSSLVEIDSSDNLSTSHDSSVSGQSVVVSTTINMNSNTANLFSTSDTDSDKDHFNFSNPIVSSLIKSPSQTVLDAQRTPLVESSNSLALMSLRKLKVSQ